MTRDGIITGADLFNLLEGRMSDMPGRFNPYKNDPQDDRSPDRWCAKHRQDYFAEEGCPDCEQDDELSNMLVDITRSLGL